MIATLIIYLDFLEKFKRLTDAQFGKLIRLGIEYQKTGVEPDIQDPILALAFDSFKVCIDENNIKYDAKVEARRAAGKKGNEVRWGSHKAAKLKGSSQTVANVANAINVSQKSQTVANVADTKTKTDTKTKNKTKTDTDNNKTLKAPERFFPDNDLLEKTFADFRDMRKKIKAPMTDRAVDLMVGKIKKLDPGTAVKMLEQSIMNGWKDIYELKDDIKDPAGNRQQPRGRFTNFPQRTYTSEELAEFERRKLGY